MTYQAIHIAALRMGFLRSRSGISLGEYFLRIAVLFTLVGISVAPASSQTYWDVQTYFKQVGLSQDQINSITKNGQAVAVNLPSRSPAEIYVFGAVFINTTPEAYLRYYSDYSHMRQQPGYLAVQKFSTPPQISDLKGFDLDPQDIQSLQKCKPGECQVQLPARVMQDLRSTINWSAPNVNDQVDQFIQKYALQRLQEYQQQGDKILGAVLNDKGQPTNVVDQFTYLLSYNKVLPSDATFYKYLLSYPGAPPANTNTWFYWDSVKFGLKPTLRIVQVFTMKGSNATEPALSIAEKQLYSSHYFETALDLTFCFASSGDPNKPGIYLVQLMGSEQAGLTGFKGSMVRKVAVSKSVSGLQTSLMQLKTALEGK